MLSQEDVMKNEISLDKFLSLNGILLPGEHKKFSGDTTDGYIIVTNYRVILKSKKILNHIPLGVIETTEIRDLLQLFLLCKDAKSFKCTFTSNESCIEWQSRILQSLASPERLNEVFALKFFSCSHDDGRDLYTDLLNDLENHSEKKISHMFEHEMKRLCYDMQAVWRVTNSNLEYKFCPTYPKKIIVPSCITDKVLESVAKFRMSRRIPAITWRHSNGAVIARSSQPEVGWLGWRSNEDESFIKALAEACACDSPSSNPSPSQTRITDHETLPPTPPIIGENETNGVSHSNSTANCDIPSLSDFHEAKMGNEVKKVLVIDARSYPSAVANRARGGGCECPEYYFCEIQFMNLANIHTVRKSHYSLRQLLSMPPDIPNWFSVLENTKWLSHISGLIKAALTVAQAIAIEGRPVLVHCSDGWDRTPQITALAQLILDPYYRTFQGFEVLIEKEWVEFGHKFSDRHGCGVGSLEDTNERSPVFLQWLDCVYQLLRQFPLAFQFNQAYLVKLAQHLYSNLFGTFLSNSSYQRCNSQLRSKTYSVWSFFQLNLHHYTNYLYVHGNEVLYPSFHLKDLEFWKSVYMQEMDSENHLFVPEISCSEEQVSTESRSPELIKTKSCDDLTSLCSSTASNPCLNRRSSDPNIRDSCFNLAGLKPEIEELENSTTDSCAPVSSNTDCDKEFENSEESTLTKVVISSPEATPADNKTENGKEEPLNVSIETQTKEADTLNLKTNELVKRPIEGSTDTLVAELGIICDEVKVSSSDKCDEIAESKSVESTVENPPSQPPKRVMQKQLFLDTLMANDDKTYQKLHKSKSSLSPVYCQSCSYLGKQPDDVSEKGKSYSYHEASKLINASEPNKQIVPNGLVKLASFIPNGHSLSSSIAHLANDERTFGLTPEHLLNNFSPIDGLNTYKDECTRRLHQIILQYQISLETIRRDLQMNKSLNHQLLSKIRQSNGDAAGEDEMSLPESVGSGSAEGSVGQDSTLSDQSWDAVDDVDWDPTLWVPDHAAEYCMGCNVQFWTGLRKHHCRNCGRIFCAECSKNSAPVPKENLFYPVRVCVTCFRSLLESHKSRYLTPQAN